VQPGPELEGPVHDLNEERFLVTTPAGPVAVIIRDRLDGDPLGPDAGTTALVGFDPARVAAPRPAAHDSGQAWQDYNRARRAEMLHMLGAVLPAVLTRVDGKPSHWRVPCRRCPPGSACPCPGLAATRQLTRHGRVADITIRFPADS
jgi:hypothetical protein